MKHIAALLISLTLIAATIVPAKADNSEEVIIGILGGALGGLIIGSAIGRNNPYVVPEPVYAYPRPYRPRYYNCYVKRVRVYDPSTNNVYRVKRRICR